MRMTNTLKVKGHENLVRDSATGAIINNSENEYRNYVRQKELAKARRMEIEQQTHEIESLKGELADIKNLLHKLLDK